MGKLTYAKICSMLAAYNCYKSGMPVETIASQAKKSKKTIYKWINTVKPR